MKHCIDINHFKVKELASELQLPKIVVAAKIALWQQQNNNFETFPNSKEVTAVKNVKPPVNLTIGNPTDTSLSNKYDESGNLIGNTLGAFMNAIVDAAKDPYVARANINHFTAGTAFMLARAGVDREWIVAFIGQPILKDLVAETNKSEGRFAKDLFVNGKKIKPIDKIIEKYKLDSKNTLKNKNGDIEITKEELIKQIKDPQNSNLELQGQVLYQFLEWQNKAKELGKLIALTKADVNGATRNLNRAKLYSNLYESIKMNNPFNGVDDLLGFNPNSTNMISTFIKNGPMAAREMFGGLFLQSTPAIEKTVDNILANAGYLNLLPSAPNERLLDQVSNEVYTAIIAQTTAFKTDNTEMISILYGTNGNSKYGDLTSARSKDLAKRINQAKLSGLSNNLLINALDTIISVPAQGTPCKISLPKNESTKKLKDDFYVAWEELDNIDPVLSQDLMKYAFYSSGFTGASGFYEHIPISLLEKYNFAKEVTDFKNKLSTNEYSADTVIDAVFKNLYYENKLVPVVPYSKMKLIVETVDDKEITHSEKDTFLLTTDDSDYIAGTDENNLPVFKRFVKSKDDNLYQLQGLLENSLGGIYVKVNTLGYKDLGRSVKEYYDTDSSTIFKPSISLPNTLATLLENSKPIPKIVGTYDNMEIPTVKDQKSMNIIEKLNYCKKQ